MISQTYDLNLIPSQIPVTIHCSQYDDGSRTFVFNLYEGASAFEIPAGASATFSGVKPDGLGFQYACSITGASQVSVDVELQMTAVAGDCPCKVTVYDADSNALGSALCVLDVERHPLQDDTVISDSAFPLIQKAVDWAEQYHPSDYVVKNQGVEQAGKVLGIGADGIVIPVESGSGSIDAEDVTYWRQSYDNVSEALDSLFSTSDDSYIIGGYVDTTMDGADRVPFFDVSTPQRKNITLTNFVNTIAPNFGSQLSLVDWGTTRAIALKDKDGTTLNAVTLNPRANNTSYDNTTSGLSATNVQTAIDEVDSTVDGLESQVSTLIADTSNYYNITDSAETTIDDADSVPFYDTSASAKKKITWANIVTKIKNSLANYFGRKLSQASGVLKLLANDDTELSSVTLSPLATNTSYTDTNSIGATNVQSAIDALGSAPVLLCTLTSDAPSQSGIDISPYKMLWFARRSTLDNYFCGDIGTAVPSFINNVRSTYGKAYIETFGDSIQERGWVSFLFSANNTIILAWSDEDAPPINAEYYVYGIK